MHTVGLPRTCLGFTNILFFLIGLIGGVICIWCAINTEFFREVNYTVTRSSLVSSIADFVNLKLWVTPLTSILIPIAVVTMLTSCCGILGAGCRMKCAIKSYIFLVTVVSLTAFWMFFMSGIYNIYTGNEKTRNYLRTTILSSYGRENDVITYFWDYVMVNYECCGATSYRNFLDSKWRKANPDMLYPVQCCKLENKTSLVPVSKDCGRIEDASILTNKDFGCLYALQIAIKNNKGKIVFYIVLLTFLYLILILFAYCIIRGQPLITSMSGGFTGWRPKGKEEANAVTTNSSLDNMLFVEEPPKKIVRVVSAVNPRQSYTFAPNAYAQGDSTTMYPHTIR
ncbi:uncharacterized protein [Epargyreus clarus]|uniref:uncharacterized protein n=1 Tax=Epargyreus clarus TaxID=520877 RepID=UPI003C30E8A5